MTKKMKDEYAKLEKEFKKVKKSDLKKFRDKIETEFGGNILNWNTYPEHHRHLWQKQIHIFQFPLYYIEYGIAQLGAIGIWKNYKTHPKQTLRAYRNALELGYSKTLPELYEAAGIRFDFSAGYIKELSDFVREQLKELE